MTWLADNWGYVLGGFLWFGAIIVGVIATHRQETRVQAIESDRIEKIREVDHPRHLTQHPLRHDAEGLSMGEAGRRNHNGSNPSSQVQDHA